MSRGTTRRSVTVKGPTYARLDAYLNEECTEEQQKSGKSGFLEAALAEEHPEIFGDDAPPPPEPTDEEKVLTEQRQKEARQRVDEKRAHPSKFFPGMAPEPRKKPKKKRQAAPEPEPREKAEPKRPPAHLQPKPEPKTEPEPDQIDDDFPTGVIMF